MMACPSECRHAPRRPAARSGPVRAGSTAPRARAPPRRRRAARSPPPTIAARAAAPSAVAPSPLRVPPALPGQTTEHHRARTRGCGLRSCPRRSGSTDVSARRRASAWRGPLPSLCRESQMWKGSPVCCKFAAAHRCGQSRERPPAWWPRHRAAPPPAPRWPRSPHPSRRRAAGRLRNRPCPTSSEAPSNPSGIPPCRQSRLSVGCRPPRRATPGRRCGGTPPGPRARSG
mmetsp:Transcript_95091/g.307866  ORF Transcript_95091/g.307866 Transcript_95091/m.307866 type:complete len:230 (-) Transcript_95091:1153-1842(-)